MTMPSDNPPRVPAAETFQGGRGPDRPSLARDGGLERSWGGRRGLFVGLGLSACIHAIILIIAMLVTRGVPGIGGAGEETERFQLAVVSEAELSVLERQLGEIDDLDVPDATAEDPVPLDELMPAPEMGLSDLTAELDAFTPTIGGESLGDSAAIGGGVGQGGGASFFGVEASGRRFAFVVDVSGSMQQDNQIVALQRALTESIDELLESNEFVVVLYATSAQPLGGRREWTPANEQGRSWAKRLISQIQASGATNPESAFQIVFGVSPAPDAVYFMTDGVFHADVPLLINSLNREPTVPIHCITFVNDAGAEMMQSIARQSGGTYTHIAGGRR